MKKSEILKLLKYLQTYYMKKFDLPENEKKMDMIVNTWYNFLKGYKYNIAEIATNKLITRKEWPPTPGEIVQEIIDITTPEEEKISGGEAWDRVISAIRRYGTVYGTKEAEANLNDRIMKAANAVGGLRIIGSSNENDTYLMNQFVKAYDSISNREVKEKLLPKSMREEVGKLTDSFTNPQLKGGEN